MEEFEETSEGLRKAPEEDSSSNEEDVVTEARDEDDDVSLTHNKGPNPKGIFINVPVLSEKEKEEFGYLPGHFQAKRVLRKLKGDRYLVELQSGETDLVSRRRLKHELDSGSLVLKKFENAARHQQNQRSYINVNLPPGMVDWDVISLSDIEFEGTGGPYRSRRRKTSDDEDHTMPIFSTDDDNFNDLNTSQSKLRTSSRLHNSSRLKHVQNESDEFEDSEEEVLGRRRSSRRLKRIPQSRSDGASRYQSHRLKTDSSEESHDANLGARRSQRIRIQPHRNARERQEDGISSRSENDQPSPKFVGAREVFTHIPKHSPFRKRHQQECVACYHNDEVLDRGPLIFCQGCTNSYHKACLGPRGSRDHLITNIGNNTFVLQCRHCIGYAQERDRNAPHFGKCTSCGELGLLSKPFRNKLTARQEQDLREKNGGVDPVTTVPQVYIDKVENVMFRCGTCKRGWHVDHLPERQSAVSHASSLDAAERLDSVVLAQKRFEQYCRSWTCKDCVENQQSIDTIVAWRPVDEVSYIPGTSGDKLGEAQKEYLIKWKAQSHFRCTWMAGSWVFSIIAPPSRIAFHKKPENELPKMTAQDAIPESFLRIDIVFDVRYTTVVKNSSKEIDCARIKDVETAFVKYKGLAYEDSIWENPPKYTEIERWTDFRTAYEDYVTSRYMSIPSPASLRRKLTELRMKDFESNLAQKTQPSIMIGGEIMHYQLDGLNWLYFQWFRQHNAILADEMGLGKTIQLISLFATLIEEHECWPFLVVVPNATCPNWRREIKKWAPSLRTVCYYGTAHARKLVHDFELFPKDEIVENPLTSASKKNRSEAKDIKAHIVITSYESIIEEKTRQSLMRVPWQSLVVDEGQRLKNDKNLLYDVLSRFKFPFKVLVTGTPLQNNARELFNLLQFLDREKHDAAELEAEYAQLTQENVSRLHKMLKPYFLRRTKIQVLTFLPPMAQIIIPITMSSLQKKVYKSILMQNPRLLKAIFHRDGRVAAKDRANLNNILLQLRKTLCHPFVYSREIEDRSVGKDASFQTLVEASAKLQLLSIMLPKLKERGHRVLLFSQFLDNLDIVEDFLDGLGMMHRRLDGSVNAMEKQKRIDEYNAADSPYFAFLLSTRAGGVGINLATADTVIILDPDFNPHQDIQALSRAHRIGQRSKVLVFQLMTRGSVEEKIMHIGKKKMALDHVLIESMDQDEDGGVDLESILRHGAEALFDNDEESGGILYDESSIDKLLDRSRLESTRTNAKQSAESQFSFARIWANDKASLEEGLLEFREAMPSPDVWDRIIQEREKTFQEEAIRATEQLGRGKRKRGNVDYGTLMQNVQDELDDTPANKRGNEDQLDGEFSVAEVEADTDAEVSSNGHTESEADLTQSNVSTQVKVSGLAASHSNESVSSRTVPMRLSEPNPCRSRNEIHLPQRCQPKITGVGREKLVETVLLTLRESSEPEKLVEQAVKYLKTLNADLTTRSRVRQENIPKVDSQTNETSAVKDN